MCNSHCPGSGVSKLVDDIAVDDGLGWPAIETFVKPAASGGAWNEKWLRYQALLASLLAGIFFDLLAC